MKKLIIVLMAAVLVAGCTGQGNGTTTASNGLAITSFTSDADTQFSGRDVRLFLEIENGGENAINASKSLIFLSGPIGIGMLQWQLVEGNLSTKLERDLNPYDPLKDIPAGRASIKWRVKAPQMDPGQQNPGTFTARAYYDYETKVMGEITAYSEAESVAAKQRGETLEKASFTTTNGPLAVSIRSIPDPVVITDKNGETMTLEMTVENIGGGTLYQRGLISSSTVEPNLLYDQLNKVYMTVDAGILSESLQGTCSGQQDLVGGKPTTLTCDIKVKMPATKAKYPIKISLDYGYYVDKPLQLTAVGKK